MKSLSLVSLSVLSLSMTACKEQPEPPKRQPPPVTVAQPVTRDVVVYKSFPATLSGRQEIEIRARVSGILEKALFEEGDLVEKDTDLFEIEPEVYDLAVEAAEAAQQAANANKELAAKSLERLRNAGNAVSKLNLEIAEAELTEAIAAVGQADAKLKQTIIDQEYSKIAAPLKGRMSNFFVDPGNLVGNGEATLLATIVDDSVIRVNFEVPERAMIRYLGQRDLDGGVERFKDKKIRLTLADGTVYGKTGKIDFINNSIDSSSRTAQVRAVFPNPEGKLSSGLYALAGFPAGPDPDDPTKTEALLVPSIAVLRDLGGDYVWVVDDKNTVRRRGIETGETVEKPQSDPEALPERETIVNKGLDGSERVIVVGLQRARDGAVVNPQTKE